MVDWSTAVSAVYTMHLKRRAALQLAALSTGWTQWRQAPHCHRILNPVSPPAGGNYSAEIELTSTLDHLLTSIAARSQI